MRHPLLQPLVLAGILEQHGLALAQRGVALPLVGAHARHDLGLVDPAEHGLEPGHRQLQGQTLAAEQDVDGGEERAGLGGEGGGEGVDAEDGRAPPRDAQVGVLVGQGPLLVLAQRVLVGVVGGLAGPSGVRAHDEGRDEFGAGDGVAGGVCGG